MGASEDRFSPRRLARIDGALSRLMPIAGLSYILDSFARRRGRVV